jgi:hypothetical protein
MDMGYESLGMWLLERSMFLFCSQRSLKQSQMGVGERFGAIVGQRRAMAIRVKYVTGGDAGRNSRKE